MNKSYLIAFLFLLLFLPMVSALDKTIAPVKQGECGNLFEICENCSYVNISTIVVPNSLTTFKDLEMTKSGTYFNYTFCDTTFLGTYVYTACGDLNGVLTCEPISFEVTGNGKENASGGVIVLFIIFFIILVGLTCYFAIYTIGHLVSLDFDIIDLAFDWGLYFVILALYSLEVFYLGNVGMETYLLWFISVGGVLLILIPIIAFVLSITVGSLSRKNTSQGVPQRMRFRRTR